VSPSKNKKTQKKMLNRTYQGLPLSLPDTLPNPNTNEGEHNTSFENAVISSYNNGQPLPGVIFTCEHSSNALPHDYDWSAHDKEHFANAHWAVDIGALKLALGIAQDL
jgi:hypothetical protein